MGNHCDDCEVCGMDLRLRGHEKGCRLDPENRRETTWNRVLGEKGFNADNVLHYRERLIAVVEFQGKEKVIEAYVHDGEWYWWEVSPGLHTYYDRAKLPAEYKVLLWLPYPPRGLINSCK